MIGFTVNTDILLIASNKSHLGKTRPELIGECTRLLEWMKETNGAALVVDTNGFILQEYLTKMKVGDYGREFAHHMAKRGKTEKVQRATGDQWSMLEARLTMHQEDRHFVRAAMASNHKCIVAEERHFHNDSKALRKHASVEVDNASAAVRRTSLATAPPVLDTKAERGIEQT